MNSISRNILAVIAGVIMGMTVNMSLVNAGPMFFPLPEGTDVSSLEGIRESIDQFTPLNFLFPFLGHAVGTFVGAWVTALLASKQHGILFGIGIGAFFLIGGISMVVMVGGPLWFIIADLVLAYIPMGWLGGWLAWIQNNKPEHPAALQGDTQALPDEPAER